VKVSFLEDNLVTQWLPVLMQSVGHNKFYALPDTGDQVAVAMQDADIGVVLGAFYSATQDTPAGVSGDVSMLEFPDGVSVKYDRSSKELTITGEAKISVEADTVNVKANTIEIEASTEHTGNVKINGNLEVNGSMSGSGNLTVDGNVNADGEVKANASGASVSLSTHVHTSASPGSPTTPPTPGT
jgi:phage baseplate assembly protein V